MQAEEITPYALSAAKAIEDWPLSDKMTFATILAAIVIDEIIPEQRQQARDQMKRMLDTAPPFDEDEDDDEDDDEDADG